MKSHITLLKIPEGNATESAAFHQLVPDCRNLILSYHICRIMDEDLPFHKMHQSASSPESTSRDLQFALQHLNCKINLHSLSEKDFPLLCNLYSLELDREATPILSHFNNLVELIIVDNNSFRDDMFQHLESLESLSITGSSGPHFLTDNLFSHLKHLRDLEIKDHVFTDRAIENLYHAGGRLKKLDLFMCNRFSDDLFSFVQGESLREVYLSFCNLITGSGLRHLRGVEYLTMQSMGRSGPINCHEAFKCLEGSVKNLCLYACDVINLDEKAMSYLKGISTFALHRMRLGELSDAAFRHVSGSIKELRLKGIAFSGDVRLSKNFLWHLSGIKKMTLLSITSIQIEAEDLPRLKEVFRNISHLIIHSNVSHDPTILKELREYVESNGGRIQVRGL